jgi:hypothetical protein
MKTELEKKRKLIGKSLRTTEKAGWYMTDGEKLYFANELLRRLNLCNSK